MWLLFIFLSYLMLKNVIGCGYFLLHCECGAEWLLSSALVFVVMRCIYVIMLLIFWNLNLFFCWAESKIKITKLCHFELSFRKRMLYVIRDVWPCGLQIWNVLAICCLSWCLLDKFSSIGNCVSKQKVTYFQFHFYFFWFISVDAFLTELTSISFCISFCPPKLAINLYVFAVGFTFLNIFLTLLV